VPNFSQLLTLISRQSTLPAPSGVRALAEEIRVRYGESAQALLFYGSCLRTGDDSEGLVDLYLLVDSYSSAYRGRLQPFLNKLLPPNVFYLELPFENRMVRAKYAVLSLRDFRRGTSMRWFHSYLWGRFAQPAGILYTRNEQAAEQLQVALAQAVITFITRVLPQVEERFTARELWVKGLSLSYGAELRAEQADNLAHLYDISEKYYEKLTRAAMLAVPFPVEVVTSSTPVYYHARIPARMRQLGRLAWAVRGFQGKVLSVLRLLKGLSTFAGGVDYILWKIERHTGVKEELTPRLRRHPLLAVCVLSWRLYRKGGFR
jgi:hypothetical protein